jgi:hypothetical protein
MENQSPPLQLRVPTPTKQSLSFCNSTPRDLNRWLADLPKANLGETARLLYQGLVELNQLDIPADERMRLLELFRPEVYFICRSLERYFLNKAIMLEERARKVANLCQALQTHLATGYKLVISEALHNPARDKGQLLAASLQRATHSLCLPLIRACQLYCPVPEGLWLELHQLYQLAAQHNLEKTAVRDGLARHGDTSTVLEAYSVALLLGCAQTNQMRQNSIAPLAEVLETWAPLLVLQSAQLPSSLYAVGPNQDAPPRYRSLFKQEEVPGLLGMDTQRLVDAIQQYLLLPDQPSKNAEFKVPEGFNLDLLQHLGAAWGEIAERTFQRNPGQGTLTLCIGMSAAHFYLAGGRSFADLLKSDQEATSATFKQTNVTDVWAGAFDAQAVDWEEGLALADIHYSGLKEDAKAEDAVEPGEVYPTYSLPVVNQSPGGYCLSWLKEVPAQLQAGELLAIQDTVQASWRVALVRWIRQVRGGGTQMGIELIAPSAQPCGLKLLRKGDPSSQYLRGLQLPAIEAISQPANLITPRLPFQQGNKVLININGVESKAVLGSRHSTSGSFNQFEFHLIDEPAAGPTPAKPHKDGILGGEEDFDSLWNSI